MPTVTVTTETEAGTDPARAEFIYERPFLYPKQLAAIFAPTRYAEIEASTKSGKTHGCLVWLFEQAFRARPGEQVWWVAPWYPTSEDAFDRACRALPRFLYAGNRSKLQMMLANDVAIVFKSAEKPDALYGRDVRAAVLDEASRMREEAFHAVRSTLTYTHGPIRMIGNVKGRKNWFWQLCRQAEGGLADHTYSKLTWKDAVEGGIMTLDEVMDAKSVLPEAVWRELYEADASDDKGNPFGLEHIRKAQGPLSVLPPAVFGIDLAKSVDWTWVIGLDVIGHVCVSARWQGPWEQTITKIRQLTGDTPTLLDSTGVGDPIVEALQKMGGRYVGYKFSSSSKQQLMEGLQLSLQQGRLAGIPQDLATELELFEYVYTRTGVQYSAPAQLHDDGVCALALADAMHRRSVGRELRLLNPEVDATGIPSSQAASLFKEQLGRTGLYWPGE